MLRILPVFLALPVSPALGWEFSPHPVCTLSHEGAEAAVELTYDPREAEPYAITLTRQGALWPPGPVFMMTFEGALGLTIGTDRHEISGGGASLTVTDRGFGNVLDGLEAGDRAVARLDDASVTVLLDGAAGPVAAFRACAIAPTS